jgi:hypothetical protein
MATTRSCELEKSTKTTASGMAVFPVSGTLKVTLFEGAAASSNLEEGQKGRAPITDHCGLLGNTSSHRS